MAETKTTETAGKAAVAADLDTSGPANIAPAEAFSTSGAPVQIVPGVDPSHPAIDNNPRAGTTFQQNAIDMNDPTLTGPEAVAQMLERQKTASAKS